MRRAPEISAAWIIARANAGDDGASAPTAVGCLAKARRKIMSNLKAGLSHTSPPRESVKIRLTPGREKVDA